jgi:hypothetical protein
MKKDVFNETKDLRVRQDEFHGQEVEIGKRFLVIHMQVLPMTILCRSIER